MTNRLNSCESSYLNQPHPIPKNPKSAILPISDNEPLTTDPPQSAPWTIRRILEWTIGHLRERKIETPRLDAEILLAHSCGCRRIELYTRYDEVLGEKERAAMRDLVRRRARHEPVAYLVGHREFFSLEFDVTPDVLIPRPDTETLVLELLDLAKSIAAPRVLDVGTGSGCIAITAAVNNKAAQVTAIDVSPAALEVAKRNAARHDVADRLTFLEGNLLSPLDASAPFDLIASNPPYVRDGDWETLQPDVRLHEPRGALTAGADGLDVIRRLIAESPPFLAAGGHLLLEIDPSQAAEVSGLLKSHAAFGNVNLKNDTTSRPRVACARKQGD